MNNRLLLWLLDMRLSPGIDIFIQGRGKFLTSAVSECISAIFLPPKSSLEVAHDPFLQGHG